MGHNFTMIWINFSEAQRGYYYCLFACPVVPFYAFYMRTFAIVITMGQALIVMFTMILHLVATECTYSVKYVFQIISRGVA